MKRVFSGAFILLCLAVFIPAAFAGEDAADFPRFNPTLRLGCAVDAGNTRYSFDCTNGSVAYIVEDVLDRPSYPWFYLALELPFAVTDRLTLTLDGAWAFSGAEKDALETAVVDFGATGRRSFNPDGVNHCMTADLLVSYALIKDAGVVRDLSVVAGLRWDYQSLRFHHPHDNIGFQTDSTNTVDFRMHTLAPVFGLDATFTGLKSGVWGGDLKLAVLAGPIVWGNEDYVSTFYAANYPLRFNGDLGRGYIVDVLAEGTLLSGKITPAMDASLAIFCRYTRMSAKGDVTGTYPALSSRAPFRFETTSDVIAFGINASLAFDLYGRPEPVSMPPAPAPVIKPKLEPMSGK
jgi:hypothetical protein